MSHLVLGETPSPENGSPQNTAAIQHMPLECCS